MERRRQAGTGDDLQHRRQARAQARRRRSRLRRGRRRRRAQFNTRRCTRATSSRTPARQRRKDGQVTIWTSTQGHFVVRDRRRQLTGPKLQRRPRHPRGDRRRLRRQDPRLPRAARRLLSSKTGRPVKMMMTRAEVFEATGPTSGSSFRSRSAPRRTARSPPLQATMRLRGRRLPRLARRRRVGCSCALRHPQRADRRLRRRHQPAQGRRLPRARRADRRLRRERVLDELASSSEHGPAGAAPEERRQAGHQRPTARPSRASATSRRSRPRSATRTTRPPQARTRAAASPSASGSTPAANPAPRSTSTRTAPSSS